MGISFEFVSIEKVNEKTREIVSKKVGELVNERRWEQCEPPHLFEVPGYEGRLFFVSEMALGFSKEEADEENPTEETSDLEAMLNHFILLSADHNIGWTISVLDEPLGKIKEGKCDEKIRKQLLCMGEVLGLGEEDGDGWEKLLEMDE